MKWRKTDSEHYQRQGSGGGMGMPMAAGGGVIGLLVLLATVFLGGGGGTTGGLSGFGDQLEDDLDAPLTEEEEFVQFLAEYRVLRRAGVALRRPRRLRPGLRGGP